MPAHWTTLTKHVYKNNVAVFGWTKASIV